ncbi:FtsP/CotA-like multicopper oxidase with cupredoxin domain [Asanoa ferruginea]|uniref:FtsP/CotA-like multicopper oxidase with cupredoxin domain n=1 Tax=Asanoa ferruginea TaxID=53367 RepID=A0A3D9ZUV2_9ACTN|nr:multicopper oxidase family protein [Asanoa ferruginea]REG00996.1 FtsP/CotA-like multicopper oxidase with cupredoxin domain [Asanoa ferruginea]GIF47596.1 hypothetical protein Afe04nite_21350 [Asanoa ferruginea]
MTTVQLILLDHGVALAVVAAWFATGVAVAGRRHRLASGLLIAAAAATVVRLATVAALSSRGWWFVQEKVLLGLPMLVIAGLAAVVIAGPPLWAARRTSGGGLVALLTAAYAALAGLLVTLLAGYPLAWSTALIAVAFVGAASLLTVRVVAAPVPRGEAKDSRAHADGSRMSRRSFLGLAGGLATLAAGGGGVALLFRRPAAVAADGRVSVTDLRGPDGPAPGGITRRHTLTARTAAVPLPSGGSVDAWTYEGQLPGPAITAMEGDLIEVTLRNVDIADGVTVHWHGYDVPCGEDGAPGVTQHAVTPGGEFVYRFRADQVGTYWYHTHQASHPAVRRGLYGTLVVRPRTGQELEELDLTLPVHTFDNTTILGDRAGRTIHVVRPGALVRLRLINTDSTPHRFALTGVTFRVAAVDGRDLHRPGEVREIGLRLPAGGRYDVVLAMPDTPVALLLDNDGNDGVLLRPAGYIGDDPAPPDVGDWPELDLLRYGEPVTAPFDVDHADRRFTIVLDRALATVDGRPTFAQTVDRRGYPSIPDHVVAEGDIVRFTVVNRSLETHPWHLHGHPVLVLSRDGTRSSGSPLWVDTFDVRPGEVWDVAFRADNPGIWMNHCHNLPHQEQGMMLRLAYEDVHSPFAHADHSGAAAVNGRRRAASPGWR